MPKPKRDAKVLDMSRFRGAVESAESATNGAMAARPKEEEEETEFKCPLCGTEEFAEVRNDNGIMGPGHSSWPLFRYCRGCTVIFMSPKSFMAKVPSRAPADLPRRRRPGRR